MIGKGAVVERMVDGVPVAIRTTDVFRQGTVTIKVKKKAVTFKKLKPQQKKALQILVERGDFSNKAKMDAAELAGYTRENGVRTMDRLLRRKPIVDELKKKGVDDSKIAQVIADGMDAMHPLAKEEKPDHHARAKFVREANTILDNYPPKKAQIEGRVFNINAELSKDDLIALEEYKRMRGEL